LRRVQDAGHADRCVRSRRTRPCARDPLTPPTLHTDDFYTKYSHIRYAFNGDGPSFALANPIKFRGLGDSAMDADAIAEHCGGLPGGSFVNRRNNFPTSIIAVSECVIRLS
jgi:hypothetical protein